jgi:phage tail-like protein
VSLPDFASAAQIAMPQVATPAVAGSIISTAASAGRSLASGVSEFSRIGLAMRFHVEVTGLSLDLGKWSSCEGLKVDFKHEAVYSAGDYASTHVLPTVVSYSPVTLKRAVLKPYSDSVQTWLSRIAAQWREADGELDVGTTVTINLLDVYQDPDSPAATWNLQKAFPSSWSGPSMNAKSGDVAMETLVLEHDGFLGVPK